MTTSAKAILSLTYTPPNSPAVNPQFTVNSSYIPEEVGVIDIPDATPSSTVFPLPFGGISSGKMLVIVNTNTQDMGIRINGAVADQFQIPAGGFLCIAGSTATAAPLTSASVVTTGMQTGAGTIQYFIFGDQ